MDSVRKRTSEAPGCRSCPGATGTRTLGRAAARRSHLGTPHCGHPAQNDNEVWEEAGKRDVLPLFIVLKNQPQDSILTRLHAQNAVRLDMAERRYKEAARSPSARENLETIHKDIDEIILAIRRQAVEEIRAQVGPDLDRIEGRLKGLGATNLYRFVFTTMVRADVPVTALKVLEQDPDIHHVSLIRKLELQLELSTPGIGAPAFWQAGFTGNGQSVGILDSGIRADHPAFGGRAEAYSAISFLAPSACYQGDIPSSPNDFNGHGTHVAGIVAGQALPGFASWVGVAYGVSKIYSMKVTCGQAGKLSSEDNLVSGIDEMLTFTANRIFNISIGGLLAEDDRPLNRRIDRLVDVNFNGVVSITAGNNGKGGAGDDITINSPGTAYNVLTVANAQRNPATGKFDQVAASSSRGPTLFGRKKPDITAPGTDIYSANHNFDGSFFPSRYPAGSWFVSETGTSMAAPHIAGAAALLRQKGITDAKSIKAVLINTADLSPGQTGWRKDNGWGFANLERAFQQSTPQHLFQATVTGRSGASPFRLYRGLASGPVSATLVWNRYVNPQQLWTLTNLNLDAYDRTSGLLKASSASPVDNVEQLTEIPGGSTVVKVSTSTSVLGLGLEVEPFALAISRPGFVPAAGPSFGVLCTGPAATSPGSTIHVECTVTNNGDLEAFGVGGVLNFQGQTGGAQQSFGTLAPGASATRSWAVTAPAAGSYTLVATVGSFSFGELFGGTGTFNFLSTATGAVPGPTTPGGLRFVSLPPCRIMETRPEYNFQGRTGAFGPPFMNAGETRTLTVPNSNVCSIPTTAKTYVLNVTLVPRGGVDFVTVWPGGEARPNFWTVRSPDGLIVANAALVKPGPGGTIQVYASHNTDVIIDISGYFTDYTTQGTNLVYYPLTPCRVVETRQDYRPQPGPFGPPSMAAQTSRRFKFPDSPHCSVPAGAAAYSFTLTAVPQGPLAFMTAWPSNQGQPNVSSINSPAGRILANSVIIPASPDGSIDVYAYDKTDFLVDINGYFAPDDGTNGQYYYPVTQCRVSDSTTGAPAPYGGPIYDARSTRTIPIPTSGCAGIPPTAKGYALNVTALPGGSPMPFLTVYPAGQAFPNASILNAFQGQVVTNSAIIPAGTNGAVNVYAFERTHVVVEVAGFFGR